MVRQIYDFDAFESYCYNKKMKIEQEFLLYNK